jgi:hypothetical protein
MTNQAFLQFETDFIESLRCIPMIVRMKLDTCGVKLKLDHWHKLSQSEREKLVEMPCENAVEAEQYRQWLQDLVTTKIGNPAKELTLAPNPPWLNKEAIPPALIDKAAELQIAITPQQWSDLSNLQRFALIKLSRPSHENLNFIPALKEFGIID